MSTTFKTVDIRGANRGGQAATRAFLDHHDLPHLRVQIVDQTDKRASSLATTWSQAGHHTKAITADARTVPVERDLDLLALLTDDPTVQWRLLENSRAKLVLGGILIASAEAGAAGGRVLGLCAVVPERDRVTRQRAGRLFQSIVGLTGGERTTSRAVSAPTWNTAQMDVVRATLYQRLADDARRFLTTGDVPGGLYVATAWPTPAVHPIELQLRQGRSRAQMRVEAGRIAASSAERCAVVYFDETTPRWIYVVIPNQRRRPVTVELPEPGALAAFREQSLHEHALREQIAHEAREQTARDAARREKVQRQAATMVTSAATGATIYATD